MRWFRHLTGTLPGRLLGEVFRRVSVGDVTVGALANGGAYKKLWLCQFVMHLSVFSSSGQ